MAQLFSGDAVVMSGILTVPTTTQTALWTHNPVRVPYTNGKVCVIASVVFNPGTSTTAIAISIKRNPAAENVQLAGSGNGISVTPGTTYSFSVIGVDSVPDGRDCVYQVQISQVGATANGTAYVSGGQVLVMSG